MISVILTNKNRNKQSLEIYNLFKKSIKDFIIVDGSDTPLDLDNVVKDKGNTVLEAKRQGVELAKNDWVLLIDSDDIFNKEFVKKLLKIKPTKNTIYIGGDVDLQLDLKAVKQDYPISETIEHLHKGNFLIEKSNYLKLTENISNYADSLYVTINHLINNGNIVVTKNLDYIHTYTSENSYTKTNRRLFLEDTQKLINQIMNL